MDRTQAETYARELADSLARELGEEFEVANVARPEQTPTWVVRLVGRDYDDESRCATFRALQSGPCPVQNRPEVWAVLETGDGSFFFHTASNVCFD